MGFGDVYDLSSLGQNAILDGFSYIQNTFIHIKEDNDDKGSDLLRAKTDPGRTQSNQFVDERGEALPAVDEDEDTLSNISSDEEDVKDDSKNVKTTLEEEDINHDEDDDVKESVDKEHLQQDVGAEVQEDAKEDDDDNEHQIWVIEGKRLRGKDTRQTHNYSIDLGDGGTTDFVMSLKAVANSKRRGQGCFGASNGVGTLEVKCSTRCELSLGLSVEIGNGGQPAKGMPPIWNKHNFGDSSTFHMGKEIDFWKYLDANDRLTIGLRVEIRVEQDKALAAPTYNDAEQPQYYGQDVATLPFQYCFAPMPIPEDGLRLPPVDGYGSWCDQGSALPTLGPLFPSSSAQDSSGACSDSNVEDNNGCGSMDPYAQMYPASDPNYAPQPVFGVYSMNFVAMMFPVGYGDPSLLAGVPQAPTPTTPTTVQEMEASTFSSEQLSARSGSAAYREQSPGRELD